MKRYLVLEQFVITGESAPGREVVYSSDSYDDAESFVENQDDPDAYLIEDTYPEDEDELDDDDYEGDEDDYEDDDMFSQYREYEHLHDGD